MIKHRFPSLAKFVSPGSEVFNALWFADRKLLEESFSYRKVLTADSGFDYIFVSPLLPTDSGIAEIASQMIEHFSVFGKVAVVCPYLEPTTILTENMFPPNCMATLVEQNPQAQILYVIANGKHYYRTVELLFDFPGVVLLHDINIQGIPNASLYGASDDFGLSQVSNAKKILVHSTHAKKLIHKNVNGKFPKIEVLPLGAPIRYISHIEQPKNDSKIVISTIGYAEHSKDSMKVFNTFVELASRNPDWEFAFVGRVYSEWLSEWKLKIKLFGLEKRFHFPGKVSNENLLNWIDNSTLCIQLRVQTNGESSGALMDILGRLKPVVVTEIGSFVEIENDLVFKVPVGASQKTLVRLIEQLIVKEKVHSDIAKFKRLKVYVTSRTFEQWFKDLILRLK